MTNKRMTRDESELRAALRAMAEEDARLAASPRVEESLMRAWDGRADGPSSGRPRRIVWTALALAASLVMAIVLRDQWIASNADPPSLRSAGEVEYPGAGETTADLSYEEVSWLDSDPASLQVVRLRVSSATLAAQGYAVSDLDGDGSVEIEMIIGADGAARRVRLIAN